MPDRNLRERLAPNDLFKRADRSQTRSMEPCRATAQRLMQRLPIRSTDSIKHRPLDDRDALPEHETRRSIALPAHDTLSVEPVPMVEHCCRCLRGGDRVTRPRNPLYQTNPVGINALF